MASFDREGALHVAKLAEQTQRYDDMAEAIKSVAVMGVELTPDEKRLLLVAFEEMIGSRRASWKILSSILVKENTKTTSDYMVMVRNEIDEICAQVLTIMDYHIIPSCKPEHPISIHNLFYLHMKGNFSWYLAEFKSSGSVDRKVAISQSLNAYKDAMAIARVKLPPTHPTRLDLALRYAEIHFDIFASRPKATEIVQQAYDEAYPELSSMNEYCKHLMQLLKHKIIQWDPADNVPPAAAA